MAPWPGSLGASRKIPGRRRSSFMSMSAQPQSDGNSAPPEEPAGTPQPATIAVTWAGEHRFDAARPDRPGIKLDGSGIAGPSPVDGLLASIAACAGIDVVEILQKRRTPPASIKIDVVGE